MRTVSLLAGLAISCLGTGSSAQSTDALPEVSQSTIGYGSVAEALEALRNKTGVQTRFENGWTIAVDQSNQAIWSFAPVSDAAYPAVAKRTVVERNGSVRVDMQVLCQAGKDACDAFVRQFQVLNDRMRESMQKRR